MQKNQEPNQPLERTAEAAAQRRSRVCQAWHRTEEVNVLCQVFAEPKARIRQGRHREVGSEGSLIPKLRGDEQEPDMRCGPSGTSWHGTAKSSFCEWDGLYKSGAYAVKVLCLTLGDLHGVRYELD